MTETFPCVGNSRRIDRSSGGDPAGGRMGAGAACGAAPWPAEPARPARRRAGHGRPQRPDDRRLRPWLREFLSLSPARPRATLRARTARYLSASASYLSSGAGRRRGGRGARLSRVAACRPAMPRPGGHPDPSSLQGFGRLRPARGRVRPSRPPGSAECHLPGTPRYPRCGGARESVPRRAGPRYTAGWRAAGASPRRTGPGRSR